jgi:hypothetical protein
MSGDLIAHNILETIAASRQSIQQPTNFTQASGKARPMIIPGSVNSGVGRFSARMAEKHVLQPVALTKH